PVRGEAAQPREIQSSLVCDAALAPQRGPLGYRLRGNRCEGLYEEMAELGSMRPVSLTLREVPVPSPELRLSWPLSSAKESVRIEASAFKPNVYYRMNTIAAASGYRWPTDVLQDLGLSEVQLGVIATADEVVN